MTTTVTAAAPAVETNDDAPHRVYARQFVTPLAGLDRYELDNLKEAARHRLRADTPNAADLTDRFRMLDRLKLHMVVRVAARSYGQRYHVCYDGNAGCRSDLGECRYGASYGHHSIIAAATAEMADELERLRDGHGGGYDGHRRRTHSHTQPYDELVEQAAAGHHTGTVVRLDRHHHPRLLQLVVSSLDDARFQVRCDDLDCNRIGHRHRVDGTPVVVFDWNTYQGDAADLDDVAARIGNDGGFVVLVG